VLDFDAKASGLAALEAWESAHGHIPGWRVRTGGGGLHIYMAGVPGLRSRKLPVLDTGLQVELKANGNYVVFAGSIHENGRRYEPETPDELDALAEAPQWLLELARADVGASYRDAANTGLAELLANRPEEGERNIWLSRVAGHYAAQLRHEDAYEQTVRAVAAPLGLERAEVERLIKSIWRAEDAKSAGQLPPSGLAVVTAAEFARVDEPGAEALLGGGREVVIPSGGDVMVYGDGGAGKTTLTTDLGCHLAAGDEWLGFDVPRPVRVLMIEAEGPRPLFRRKIERKLAGWLGGDMGDRLRVLENPWPGFTFASDEWRETIAAVVREQEIDVLIVGPLTRVGMDSAGTLQDVSAFAALVADVRDRSRRPLTVILVHHENKGGTVSGAWEGAADTLIHVEARGNGKTCVTFQKARWASETHGTSLDLAWTGAEGFCIAEGRDLIAEVQSLLAREPWRTAREIAAPVGGGGVGANTDKVKALLKDNPDTFCSRKGSELGRSAQAVLWGLAHSAEPAESAADSPGTGAATDSRTRPKGESVRAEAVPAAASDGPERTSQPETHESTTDAGAAE
jgi:hypothetical protein